MRTSGFVTSLLLLGLVAGCKTHTVVDRHIAASAPSVNTTGKLVLLGRSNALGTFADNEFVQCVGTELAKSSERLAVMLEQTFVDAMYPWFETNTAPASINQLNDLLANAPVKQRFEDLEIKYLIWIQGRTETLDKRGSITCSVSPAGGGCFGFKSWDDEADYEAALWRVDEPDDVGKIGTRTTGTSYLPAVILPLPLLARVKDAACDSMAAQLMDHLVSAP